MKHLRPFILGVFCAILLAAVPASLRAADYDPLSVPADVKINSIDTVVPDQNRRRDIPVLIYLPPVVSKAPIVLFSHGLGGSRNLNAFMGEHWAARGYVAVFLQHPGSDNTVWEDVAPARRLAALRSAANAQNLLLRAVDVPAVLDQLDKWNRDKSHPLYGRLDLDKVGMSGHSFGAITTQAVSGQIYGRRFALLTDERIKAALPMSPSSPDTGSAETAFGKVKIPWMLMTGTNDNAPIGNQNIASRLEVFPALPKGDKYELVLDEAEHSAFTDRALPGDSEVRNPNHHRVMLALSTAFWDAYLMGDKDAERWLQGDGPRSVMEPADRWQMK